MSKHWWRVPCVRLFASYDKQPAARRTAHRRTAIDRGGFDPGHRRDRVEHARDERRRGRGRHLMFRRLQRKGEDMLVVDTDLLDYICLENERDIPHLVGK